MNYGRKRSKVPQAGYEGQKDRRATGEIGGSDTGKRMDVGTLYN